MRISVFLSYQRTGHPDEYDGPPYPEKLAEAKVADAWGVHTIWVPEHHLIHFMQTPSTLLLAAQMGLSTSARIGTMVSLLNYRHPLISAGEIATADHILEGRLELGVGRGAYEYEFEILGIPFAEGKPRFNEMLRAHEEIWHSPEGAVAFEGEFTSFDSAYVWPRPYQEPHPPVWVAAMTEPTIEQAVRDGYHITNWPFLRGLDRVQHVCDVFHTTREAMGVPRGEQKLGILRGAWVAETEEKAARHVETALINHRINQRLHHFTQKADPRGYVEPEPIDNEPSREDIYENLLMGTPDQVLEKLQAYEDAGVDEVLLMFDFGAPHEEVMESMQLWGDEVMPRWREREGKTEQAALAGERSGQ
jgi:alkanesulfonate monooxygenase SsuD/methylene tetrahydromethanopterin reductase-like flavin-dependent oxidoreductase (luciferase family)